jgi:ATP-binding cassette, subfamily B, bacterial MsbA
MRQLTRLLRYVEPYWLQLSTSVVSMALVGLLDAFRVLLIGPILDSVLNPATQARQLSLFTIPGTNEKVYLQQLVPTHFQNAWTVVAFALVASTLVKGIFDYAGTYLVNYAGYGMITDLRNDLYSALLYRSAAFFQRHATGTLLSTIINDIERVQYAMSTVLAEFLQQVFTLIFTAVVVVLLGGKLAWVLVLFIPFIIYSAGPPAAVRISWPTSKTSCTKPSPAIESSKLSAWKAGRTTGSVQRREGFSGQICGRCWRPLPVHLSWM